tara:strand:+ start:1161 stop:1544 length:384 start_codon:yes stop_codon:yes gene_type:complete
MKQAILKNVILSISACALVYICGLMMPYVEMGSRYYVAIIFHFTLYAFQIFILSRTNKKEKAFVMIYSALSFFKILLSILFIVIYLSLFSHSHSHESQIIFLGAFLVLYFSYLILNTIAFFSNTNKF